MRLVVGYKPNRRGVAAVNLAWTMARAVDAHIDLVVVLPPDTPTFDMYSPDKAFNAALEATAREWLDQGLAILPEGVSAQGHVVRAETVAEGLMLTATDPDYGEAAGLIVVGPAKRGLIGRFSIGGNASALLHASPVPVALAPVKYEGQPAITRITCATGTRPGAEALVELAISWAGRWQVPLRLMSLLPLGKGRTKDDRHEQRVVGQRHVDILVEQAKQALPDAEGGPVVTGVVGSGKSLEDGVRKLDFEDGEIVMVGSSRLAGPRQIFIGASASNILHVLPVPMIVVPREYEVSAS